MHRYCGLDLNGWRDTGCRNWTMEADGEERSEISYIKSDVLPSLVGVGDRRTPHWVAEQATLAPHGRGPGWGEIGDMERRVAIRDLFAGPDADIDLLAAALFRLGHGASHAVLAIDDTPRGDEVHQEKLLLAMHRAGLPRRLLVWRSVLAVLAVIQSRGCKHGNRIGVIVHDREGFAIQTLLVRGEAGRLRFVLAPERRSGGWIDTCAAGYAGLERVAIKAIESVMSKMPNCETPRAVGRLAFGLNAAPEILRTDTGKWKKFVPPRQIELPLFSLSEETLKRLTCCDAIVFESLIAGTLRTALVVKLERELGREIIELSEFAIAEAALVAAKRMARDEPVYFDFLPQISTIVDSSDTQLPKNYDLIEANATLPAGRVYRSQQPAELGLKQGADRLTVYLKKENARWPRKALVDLGTRMTGPARVELSVEQVPLEGRARIILRSNALSRQHTIDWGAAEVVDQDWDSLIEELEPPIPTIPKRLVLPCGMKAWNDWYRRSGLLALLKQSDGVKSPKWDAMATILSSRPKGQYCISSDGNIPLEVPSEAIEQLNRLTERATIEELQRFEHKIVGDNARLKFLLWQFRRCPDVIVEQLVGCVTDSARWQEIFPHRSSWTMIFQGIGRCTKAGSRAERDMILYLLKLPIDKWRWREEKACAAFMLSRSDHAPRRLERKDVEMIAKAIILDFEATEGGNFNKFLYAPYLMAGLLRWRIKERRALIKGDELADSFTETIIRTLPYIEKGKHSRPNLEKYEKVLKEILKELRGEGTNPFLLREIDELK